MAPITQELIRPGETYTYEFTVHEPAMSMHHAQGQEAIPNGLFGTIFIGEVPIPSGRTVSGIEVPAAVEIAQNLPMVLNDSGVIRLSLDGKSFPATARVVAKLGDWIQVTYCNEGMQVHPMHLHGFEQIVTAKDGEPLDHPYAADTVLVAPGERYTVLFNPDQRGTWVWHCHIINHVESADGMFGMVTASSSIQPRSSREPARLRSRSSPCARRLKRDLAPVTNAGADRRARRRRGES